MDQYTVFPLDQRKLVGLVAFLLCTCFSNVAGTGGGALYVVVEIIFYGFSMPVASALSNSIIGIGAIIRFITLIKKKHPMRDVPLVDYNTAMLFLPGSLLGSKFGVMIYGFFPEGYLVIALGIALLAMAISIVITGIRQNRESGDKLLNKDAALEQEKYEEVGIAPELAAMLEKDRSPFPPFKFVFYFFVMAVTVVLNLFEGSSNVKSILGFEKCSFSYWLMYFLDILAAVALTAFAAFWIMQEHNLKVKYGYVFATDEVKTDIRGTSIIFLASFSTGVLSAGFGIGGTMFFIPILIHLGYIAEVASSTSLFVLIFKAFATLFFYAYQHQVHYWYMIFFNIPNIIATFASTFILFQYINKTGKSSIIVLTLGALLLFCSILLPSYSIFRGLNSKNPQAYWKFKNFCG